MDHPMRKATHKIKAFTLTEMMVVIVISAIVVGLAFTILSIIQKNMRNIEENYDHHAALKSLEVSLTIDFTKYPNAVWNPKANQLVLSSPIAKKAYTFTTDSIVNKLDTFMVNTKNFSFYFEGKKVNSGSIDAIKLTFNNTTAIHRIFVFKHNDPTIHF